MNWHWKLRDHICYREHKAESTNWKLGEATGSQRSLPVTCILQRGCASLRFGNSAKAAPLTGGQSREEALGEGGVVAGDEYAQNTLYQVLN